MTARPRHFYKRPPVYLHKPELSCPCGGRAPDVGQTVQIDCHACGRMTMGRP